MQTPTFFRQSVLQRFLAACLMGPTIFPLAAVAQQSASASAPMLQFTIAAGPLGQALNQFSQSAGIYLGGAASLVQGRQTAGLHGTYSVEQGLAVLLVATDLQARNTGPGRYALQPKVETATLTPIMVRAGTSTQGSIQDGFVAMQSRIGKIDEALHETPRSVSVVTRAQMDARGSMSVLDAVTYTAGVTTGGAGFDPRFDQISIRGFQVNIKGDYLDGLRQTPGIYATPRTEAYLLERVDIVKGPMSVLYGQGTPGGLVNRVSKRPTDTPVRELMLTGASHDRKQLALDIGDDINESGTARFRVTGLIRRGEHEREIADDRDVLASAFDFQLSEKTTLTLRGQYIKDETDGGVGTYVDNGRPTSMRISDPDYDYQRQTEYQLGYELEHRYSDALTLSQQLRYGDLDMKVRYLDNAGLRPGTRIMDRSAWSVGSKVKSLVVDNRALMRLQTGTVAHQLLAGFDYQWVDWDNRIGYLASGVPPLDLDHPHYGNVSLPTPDYNLVSVKQRDQQLGYYLSHQADIGNWRLSLGGRYDVVRQRNEDVLAGGSALRKKDDAFTWQAGVLYLSDSGFAPYLSYATSFTPNSSLNVQGRPLDPTRGAQIEAGIKYQLPGHRSQITLAAYQIDETDAVRSVPGTAYSELAGKLRSRGIELEAVAELADGLDLTAYYSYNRSQVRASNNAAEIGKTPSRQPRHVAGAWLDYRLSRGPLAGLGFGAGARYVGSSYGDTLNTMHNPASTLVDLAVSYEPGRRFASLKGWKASLNVQNVADKEVPVCNSGYCYLGVGRQVMASLRYRW
ncbi:TonB-dependent siderophore receptor [Alcaligenes sp. 13f]|uniref:TonB-dependent siderophore receptor n=1 Tax=Alcaligenes sp. 13f TaxID=2841924 RepID=UPI001CF6F35E|nr:TonB-dependent siderophore receptor [Alcaligenes sp. 13f]MCB4320712.1 TonB-dependent siderophore receptor [Alcaligenes sp. 13f]